MGEIIILWLILIAVIFLVAYYAGKEFERIAAMKGFVDKKFFWWTFFLPPVGMLMVIALPDRVGARAAAPVQDEQLPEL